jgi:hypothetical protein
MPTSIQQWYNVSGEVPEEWKRGKKVSKGKGDGLRYYIDACDEKGAIQRGAYVPPMGGI